MKYIITGSLGNTSKPIVASLIADGHEVVVITSDAAKAAQIEKMGAKPAVGSLTDREFVMKTFRDGDIAYLMIPPNFEVDDFPVYQEQVADNYRDAIEKSKIRHVVVLSSIGAHLGKGAGPIDGLAYLEQQLQTLDVNAIFLRPSYYFSNFLNSVEMLRAANIMGANFGSRDEKIVLTHYADIIERAIYFLKSPGFTGYAVEYISSDERYPYEIANILGKAVGRDNVQWVTFPDDDALAAMLQGGIKPSLANSYKDMGAAIRSGKVQEDYWKVNKQVKGKYKLEDFAQTFARAFNNSLS